MEHRFPFQKIVVKREKIPIDHNRSGKVEKQFGRYKIIGDYDQNKFDLYMDNEKVETLKNEEKICHFFEMRHKSMTFIFAVCETSIYVIRVGQLDDTYSATGILITTTPETAITQIDLYPDRKLFSINSDIMLDLLVLDEKIIFNAVFENGKKLSPVCFDEILDKTHIKHMPWKFLVIKYINSFALWLTVKK